MPAFASRPAIAASFAPDCRSAIAARARARSARGGDRGARTRRRVGGGRVEPAADVELIAFQVHVVAAAAVPARDRGGGGRLGGALVRREAGIAMRAEELAVAELVRQLGEQRQERLAHRLLV